MHKRCISILYFSCRSAFTLRQVFAFTIWSASARNPIIFSAQRLPALCRHTPVNMGQVKFRQWLFACIIFIYLIIHHRLPCQSIGIFGAWRFCVMKEYFIRKMNGVTPLFLLIKNIFQTIEAKWHVHAFILVEAKLWMKIKLSQFRAWFMKFEGRRSCLTAIWQDCMELKQKLWIGL